VFGAGLGIGLPGLSLAQKPLTSPAAPARRQDPAYLELTGNIRPVHDPTLIKEGDTYYLFCTGNGIPVRESADMLRWKMSVPAIVRVGVPDWVREYVGGTNDIWAPDISYYNDKFHLYYSVSLFGMNTSVIGLATNKTLNRESDDFEWIDEGLIIASVASDNYNCIDPNLALDADGNPWLAFGSFWTGIKMIRLDPDTGRRSTEDNTLYPLAQRHINDGAIEAPIVIRKGDYYYLFVSFDFCCRGVQSTYYVVVGRSENITGPYIDRDGVEMLNGGGTQVTFPTERWRGPGHCAIYVEDDVEYLVHHAYDVENEGSATLRIAPLAWDADGWPSIASEA
jgi:arabinan endo-1,5-alpha-L-arabinosidase